MFDVNPFTPSDSEYKSMPMDLSKVKLVFTINYR